jgi:hypothetical protein
MLEASGEAVAGPSEAISGFLPSMAKSSRVSLRPATAGKRMRGATDGEKNGQDVITDTGCPKGPNPLKTPN